MSASTACRLSYGDEDRLVHKLLEAIPDDLAPAVGVGDAKFPAFVAARTGRAMEVTWAPYDPARFFSSHSIDLLPLSSEMKTSLGLLGLHTMGDVAKLPRDLLIDQFSLEGTAGVVLECSGDQALPWRRVIHFKPLSGEGARRHGGRFNSRGIPTLISAQPQSALKPTGTPVISNQVIQHHADSGPSFFSGQIQHGKSPRFFRDSCGQRFMRALFAVPSERAPTTTGDPGLDTIGIKLIAYRTRNPVTWYNSLIISARGGI